jgi:hypothetical protein
VRLQLEAERKLIQRKSHVKGFVHVVKQWRQDEHQQHSRFRKNTDLFYEMISGSKRA